MKNIENLIFAKIAHHIKILVSFAVDSDKEEAEAASQSQHFC